MKKLFTFLISSFVLFGCGDDDATAPAQQEECETLSISNCAPTVSGNTLDIVTWNIKRFPTKGASTICKVKGIIEALDVDVIAVQEINDTGDFKTLIEELEGWEGAYYNVRGDIELGFLYKTAEITSITELETIFPDNSSAFPREPVMATVTHKNGLTATLVNLHLKCCDEGEQRRSDASELLKGYLDTEMPEDNFIVVGDFNDDILEGSPFENFISDPDNYQFADQSLASGTADDWSYPSWPSHIDHLLISNELFDNLSFTGTIKLEGCVEGYSGSVSDHRPVMISLQL